MTYSDNERQERTLILADELTGAPVFVRAELPTGEFFTLSWEEMLALKRVAQAQLAAEKKRSQRP